MSYSWPSTASTYSHLQRAGGLPRGARYTVRCQSQLSGWTAWQIQVPSRLTRKSQPLSGAEDDPFSGLGLLEVPVSCIWAVSPFRFTVSHSILWRSCSACVVSKHWRSRAGLSYLHIGGVGCCRCQRTLRHLLLLLRPLLLQGYMLLLQLRFLAHTRHEQHSTVPATATHAKRHCWVV